MVAEVAGMETPMPSPDRPSATTITTSPDDGPSVANRTIERKRALVPNSVAFRSPVRTAM